MKELAQEAPGAFLIDFDNKELIKNCKGICTGNSNSPLNWSLIRRASAQGVSDHRPWALDISPFHLFELYWNICNRSQLKQPSSSIFSIFVWNNCNCNQLKQMLVRIRAIIRAREIVTVELCAREAASLGAIGHGDREAFSSRGLLFFETIFGTVFSQTLCQMEPRMA